MKPVFALLLCLLWLACQKQRIELPAGVPECIAEKLSAEYDYWSACGTVSAHRYKEEVIYLFQNCHSMHATLYDAECNQVGGSGCFVGFQMVDEEVYCPELHRIRVVWTARPRQ